MEKKFTRGNLQFFNLIVPHLFPLIMKYSLIIIILILISDFTFGQETPKTDFMSEIVKRDISGLFTLDKFNIDNDTVIVERMEPLGFIGPNYQRLQIHFITVIKNPFNPYGYFVYGKTKVKNSICSFHGTLIITESTLYVESDLPDIKQGTVKGKYELNEDPIKKRKGIFTGKFESDFYIDQNNNFKYDAINFGADGFCNNQFEGIWTSHQKGEIKKCNWGDYRIPDSGDLDIGAGEFFVNEKYLKYGWRNYIKSYGYHKHKNTGVKAALKKETEKWWN